MNTTLDEWEILHSVVQLGGFAAAAKKLNRSQSTISYAIGRLQDQLGVKLFEMKGRKALLTPAARALLADAEPLLSGFAQLERRARSLISGAESEIRLSVDSLYPNEKLFAALTEFARRFPYVHPRVRQATFLSSGTEFGTHEADLCITGLVAQDFFVKPILEIRLQAVAHSGHPLTQKRRALLLADLVQHLVVSIEGIAPGEPRHQPRLPSQRFLAVNTVEAAIEAVRSGLCFGWLPLYRIQQYLDRGELVPLNLAAGANREVRFDLVCRNLDASSRELRALGELLGLNSPLEVI